MNFYLSNLRIHASVLELPVDKKLFINTINAHSFNIAKYDIEFQKTLQASDILLPDGVSIVYAIRLLVEKKIKRITGADLFNYEMERLNKINGSCFFLGSNEKTLEKILEKAATEYPQVKIETYSPPYKQSFSEQESIQMIQAVNSFKPDVLFIGMTAPKQEKWAFAHFSELEATHVCSIGAVFDFYAGNIKRAPIWMQNIGLEWFYRLISEPKRMWKRYLVGNTLFVFNILKEMRSQKR